MKCHCKIGSAKSRNSRIVTEFEYISFQRLCSRAKEMAVWGTHNYPEYSKFITDKVSYQVSQSKFLVCLQIKHLALTVKTGLFSLTRTPNKAISLCFVYYEHTKNVPQPMNDSVLFVYLQKINVPAHKGFQE